MRSCAALAGWLWAVRGRFLRRVALAAFFLNAYSAAYNGDRALR